MKLRRRQKRKTEQALDVLASATKIWSEWQVGKRAGKGIAKAKALRPPGKVKQALGSTPVKAAGALALVGGVSGALFKKLRGGEDPATSYEGPAPSAAYEATASAPDAVVPPLAVAPEPDDGGIPAAGAAALREPPADEAISVEPAIGAAGLRDVSDDATAEEPVEEDPAAEAAPAKTD